MIISSPSMTVASSLLNPNAFPLTTEEKKEKIKIVVNRFAIFLHNCSRISEEVETAISNFHDHLQHNWSAYVSHANRAQVKLIAYADGLEYTTCLYSILYEFKAFLDVYVPFLCKIINGKEQPVHGFKSSTVQGSKLSGGKFVNWLARQKFPQKDSLQSFVLEESSNWITTVVKYRDDVAHYRDLPGLQHARIPLTKGPSKVNKSDILQPMMPDGTELIGFVEALQKNLGTFVDTSLRMLPAVNISKLEIWGKAVRRINL